MCSSDLSVISTSPAFEGGVQAGSRDDRDGYRRETLDPDDFSGGFALWSGTSFAAPFVAGMLARGISTAMMAGDRTAVERIAGLQDAAADALSQLALTGPRHA